MKKIKGILVVTVLAIFNSTLVYGHTESTSIKSQHNSNYTEQYHNTTEQYHNQDKTSSQYFDKYAENKPSEKINICLDGKEIDFEHKPYLDENKKTMVSITKVAEMFNATVTWDKDRATLKNNSVTIIVKANDNSVIVNGENIKMDTKAVVKDGKMFVPISSIAKALGMNYSWDSYTNTVNIESRYKH